jgi:FtsP/CotA-like multicopper oxidase with cupredoxin domain
MPPVLIEERVQEQIPLEVHEKPAKKRPPFPKWIVVILVAVTFVLIAAGMSRTGFSGTARKSPSLPNVLPAPSLPSGAGVPAAYNMGMPGAPISITTLQAPLTSTHMKQFTLVAENGVISLGSGIQIPAWTFNGMSPGPTLRVQQGDLVVVRVVNHLSFGITIHWHGINGFNASDGVAGLTQDAIKPGQTYIYRFVAEDPGTYWYHSHQMADVETMGGLFGMLIVTPKVQTIHADVDYAVALHEWNGPNNQTIFSLNDTAGELNEVARPGQWVRLRLVETSNAPSTAPHLVTLIGAPFQVITTDENEVNEPQWLNETPVPIGTAQRYDLLFQMPAHGSVSLVTAEETDNLHYQRAPAIVFGQGSVPATLPAMKPWLNLATYGEPTQTAITLQSHFNVTADIALGEQVGTSLGRMGMTYTLNGKVFPNTGMLMVHEGDLVEIRFINQTDLYHPMHIHGHVFTILAINGKPPTGSPIHQDTVLIPPHATYEVGFLANDPGLWMLHCHNFLHANWGMDMMVDYYGYSTPYSVGTKSGNFPD